MKFFGLLAAFCLTILFVFNAGASAETRFWLEFGNGYDCNGYLGSGEFNADCSDGSDISGSLDGNQIYFRRGAYDCYGRIEDNGQILGHCGNGYDFDGVLR